MLHFSQNNLLPKIAPLQQETRLKTSVAGGIGVMGRAMDRGSACGEGWNFLWTGLLNLHSVECVWMLLNHLKILCLCDEFWGDGL